MILLVISTQSMNVLSACWLYAVRARLYVGTDFAETVSPTVLRKYLIIQKIIDDYFSLTVMVDSIHRSREHEYHDGYFSIYIKNGVP